MNPYKDGDPWKMKIERNMHLPWRMGRRMGKILKTWSKEWRTIPPPSTHPIAISTTTFAAN